MPKYHPALRFPLIFFIVYLSFVGGMVETTPLMKIVHQIGFAVIIGAWLWGLARSERGFPVTRLNAPLWVLGLGWLIAAVRGFDFRISFEYVWLTFVHLMLFFIFVDLIRAGHLRWLMEGLFITGSVIVLMGMLEMLAWYLGWQPISGGPVGWPQLEGWTSLPPQIHELSLPLSHNNLTGAYAVVLMPLAFAWGNTKTQQDLRWALRFLALCLLGVTLLTQSRGAYLALMTILGLLVFFWLLRPDVRDRLPRHLQPLVTVRSLLIATAIAALFGFFVSYSMVLGTNNPSINDVTRLNLWYSAIDMFRDYPVTGVGPFLFRVERLTYGIWDKSYLNIGLNHAHSLFFNVIAEGGLLILTVIMWGIVRFGHIWWDTWRSASRSDKRRLEGVLVACAGFAMHNMVDAFLETQVLVPLLIVVAYVVTIDPRREQAETLPHNRQRNPARVQIWLGMIVLIVAQVAFIPIDRGALQQHRFLGYRAQEDQLAALDAVRQAQKADPWLGLYDFEEAITLGHLADEDPDHYLTPAIQAFEEVLSATPTWDVGWHNLAGLYAQAHIYDQAIDAEKTAVALYPLFGYWMKLGEYYHLSGDQDAAQESYSRALEDTPWLAGSDYWHDTGRQVYLTTTIDHAQKPSLAIDLRVYSGNFDTIPHSVDPDDLDAKATQDRLDALWFAGEDTPCVYCYHVRTNSNLLAAEKLLFAADHTPENLNRAETLADKALFLRGSRSEWGWYILARIAEQRGDLQTPADQDRFTTYLTQAVRAFYAYPYKFERVFRMTGGLGYLPQAQFPIIGSIEYEPWITLSRWQLQHGEMDDAAETYEKLQEADPYVTDIQVE